MKYAETWLYGSVRTHTPPMRPSVFSTYPEVPGPVLISTPQKPTPHNYAVILCSCPEYLNGTKKSNSTKVSICKKCKGSRLPLTITDAPRLLVGGTVRGPQLSRDTGLLRSGTVKVQSSKSRPSILKSQNNDSTDPYDLMRRSRLAPPHEARIGSQFSTVRSRAKSISPSRRSSPSSSDTLRKNRSKSVSRVNEIWIDESSSDTNESKKSILSCDINPYDLVKSNTNRSNSLVEIEFDDDMGEIFKQNIPNGSNIRHNSKSKSNTNVKAISGQRIRVADEFKSCMVEEVSVYDSVNFNYDLKNYDLRTQELSSSVSLPNIKKENKKSSSISKNTSKKLLNTTTTNRAKPKSVSPKRPPRRIRNNKTDDDSESDNQRFSERNFVRKSNTDVPKTKYKNTNTDTIKSILKKPRNYDNNTCENNRKTERIEDITETKRVNSSQFYLPKPTSDKKCVSSQNTMLQRKRVQFLVENDETKIIYTAEFNLTENTVTGIPGEIHLESEEDIVAQGDVVSHSLNDSNAVKLTEITSQNENIDDTFVYEDINISNKLQRVISGDVIKSDVSCDNTNTEITDRSLQNCEGNYI